MLTQTRPGRDAQGAVNKARFETDRATAERARGRVAELLARFPLYPELGEL